VDNLKLASLVHSFVFVQSTWTCISEQIGAYSHPTSNI